MESSFRFETPQSPVVQAVVVGTAFTTILSCSIDKTGGGRLLNFEVQNLGATAFSDFKIQLLDHPSGTWYDYIGAADFTSGTNPMVLWAVGAPGTLAGGSQAHGAIQINAAYAFLFLAKVASGSTTAQVLGNVRVA